MLQVPMPLPATDYHVMKTSHADFSGIIRCCSQDTQHYVINATHRLAEVHWLTRTLDEQVKAGKGPVANEGILSLQLYLLLTCADTLGHIHATGVGKRFKGFFDNLSRDAKRNLTDNVFAWKTSAAEMVSLGLEETSTDNLIYPTRRQILDAIQPLTTDKRLDVIVDFLVLRRHAYTHESEYPKLGYHPNLSVMQKLRLGVPNVVTLGEHDRLQVIDKNNDIYFAYYETDDVVSIIRWSILQGLGRIIGTL